MSDGFLSAAIITALCSRRPPASSTGSRAGRIGAMLRSTSARISAPFLRRVLQISASPARPRSDASGFRAVMTVATTPTLDPAGTAPYPRPWRRTGSGGPPGLQNQWYANSVRWVRFPSASARRPFAGLRRPSLTLQKIGIFRRVPFASVRWLSLKFAPMMWVAEWVLILCRVSSQPSE